MDEPDGQPEPEQAPEDKADDRLAEGEQRLPREHETQWRPVALGGVDERPRDIPDVR